MIRRLRTYWRRPMSLDKRLREYERRDAAYAAKFRGGPR